MQGIINRHTFAAEFQKHLLMKHLSSNFDNCIKIIDDFKSMTPFIDEYDIPNIPIIDEEIYKNVIVPNLIRCGALQKSNLIKNKIYIGSSKYTKEAVWKGDYFVYLIDKWGTKTVKKIPHFEDYNGDNIFIPIKQLEETWQVL